MNIGTATRDIKKGETIAEVNLLTGQVKSENLIIDEEFMVFCYENSKPRREGHIVRIADPSIEGEYIYL